MSAVDGPVGDAEAEQLFADLATEQALIVAISGGPDSTALLHLMARWRMGRPAPPHLVAVTIDHGLRLEARREATAVKRLCKRLGVEHRTMRWHGPKPSTGIQEAARAARYRLLRDAARRVKARCVLTAHTLDDQAETVLFRMARGSGLSGMCAMARRVPIDNLVGERMQSAVMDPAVMGYAAGDEAWRSGAGREADDRAGEVWLVRPLLDLTKARLIVTLQQAGITYADDPSNADPRFARSRWRRLMPGLAAEGLTPQCLARLARRVQRSEAAHEAAVNCMMRRLCLGTKTGRIAVNGADWREIPTEIALRLLGRLIGAMGNEGPVEFGKLEALTATLEAALAADGTPRFRRTLAGAMVSLQNDCIVIERAPARRSHLRHQGPGPPSEPVIARRKPRT